MQEDDNLAAERNSVFFNYKLSYRNNPELLFRRLRTLRQSVLDVALLAQDLIISHSTNSVLAVFIVSIV